MEAEQTCHAERCIRYYLILRLSIDLSALEVLEEVGGDLEPFEAAQVVLGIFAVLVQTRRPASYILHS